MSKIWPEKTEEIIEEVFKLVNKYWISTKKLAGIISDSRNYADWILETESKFSIFWTPDEKQKEMIKSWDEDFRQKMIDAKLKYNEETTELKINWKILTFDKDQPITESMSWDDSMKAIEEEWREWINKNDLESLVELLEWKEEVLNLTNIYYWSSATNATYTNYAWYGNFNNGHVNNYTKTDTNKYTICIHKYSKK